MTNLGGVVKQLKKEHERLTREIKGVAAALAAFGAAYGKGSGTPSKISAAGRARIAAAQKARWAKVKREAAPSSSAAKVKRAKPKRKLSEAGRKAISEATKKRWALKRAEGQQALPATAKKAAVKASPARAVKKAAEG